MMTRSIRRTHHKISGFEIVIFVLLALYTIVLLSLFLWGLISCFRPHDQVILSPLKIFSDLSFKNFSDLFSTFSFKTGKMQFTIFDLFTNSMLYAVLAALAQTFCTAVVAYCTAKYPCKFSSFISGLVVVVTILPVVGNLPSMIVVTRDYLHVYGTILGVILMKFGFATVYYFIFYAAFKRISWEYAEAAFIDGASHYRVFFTIMLPLVSTLLGTIFLLNFIGYWNDFETPYVFLTKSPTLSVGLYGLMTGNGVSTKLANSVPILLCAAFAVFLPVLILFIVFRNKIMGSLQDGGIKG